MASGIYTEIKKKIELAEPRTELFSMWRFFIWMMGIRAEFGNGRMGICVEIGFTRMGICVILCSER